MFFVVVEMSENDRSCYDVLDDLGLKCTTADSPEVCVQVSYAAAAAGASRQNLACGIS